MTAFAVLALTLLLVGCAAEVRESSYPTYAAALADGAVRRGWIPAWLPADAVEIREVHDLDSSQSAMAFRLSGGRAWEPGASCRAARPGQFFGPRFRRAWIPGNLEGFRYFMCDGDPPRAAGDPPWVSVLAASPDGTSFVHWRYVSP